MRWWRTVRFRLLASYLLVVAAGAVTLIVVASWAAPAFFSRHMAGMGSGMGMMAGIEADLDAAFVSSIRQAMLVGVLVSLAVALLVAAVVSTRIVRPLEGVRITTRRLAEGNYSERVALPVEEELRALAVDVNTLAATLEDTEQRRLQLIGDLAHELRTPLSAIEGYMEGLIDGVVPAEAETFASVAEEAARLKRLASDLSTLSRIQHGEGALRRIEVDLATVAAAVASRLRPQFDDQQVELTVHAPQLTVSGDPDRLTQVMVNLLGNALTHTPAGGRVEVSGRRAGDLVELSVRDTGAGIASTDLPRIFDRFYRANISAPGGSGIGLTIARAIARAHGGDVTADSDGAGTGATFTLQLPAV